MKPTERPFRQAVGPRSRRRRVLAFADRMTSSGAILTAHCPFAGVMEVIHWFRIQPRTGVGLNSGRPAVIREETLRSLNELGKQYRVAFSDDLLFMNPGGWNENVENAKVAGLRYFQKAGYRVFAAVDNEPANLAALGRADDRLWFNGDIEVLGEGGFRKLVAAFPGAVIQCSIDFLTQLIETLPEEGKRVLGQLRGWGINRFSLPWELSGLMPVIDRMESWGFEINIYNVPDLESFLQAVLQPPRSVTSDFNFPKWHYYGRGSGENAQRHEYEEPL